MFNIGPRAGFAWTLDEAGRTVVRGGFGVLFSPITLALIQNNVADPFIGAATNYNRTTWPHAVSGGPITRRIFRMSFARLYLDRAQFAPVPVSSITTATLRPGDANPGLIRGPGNWSVNLSVTEGFARAGPSGSTSGWTRSMRSTGSTTTTRTRTSRRLTSGVF